MNVVECEVHFLAECSLYDDLRYNIFQKAMNIDNTFITMDSQEKYVFLMTNKNISLDVIKGVDKMFSRRKLFTVK